MTKFKKVTALLLSLLMAFSTFAVLGSAVQFDNDGEPIITGAPELTVKVAFAKDGNELADLSKVAPGDDLTARIYLGTNYYSTNAEFKLYYDAGFFDVTGFDSPASLDSNDANTTVSGIGIEAYARKTSDGVLNLYTSIPAEIETVFQYDDSTWMFEFDVTVKDDASGTGTVYADKNDLCSTGNTNGSDNFPYGDEGDEIIETVDLAWIDASANFSNNSVTVENSVTFDANGGYFGNQTETTKVVRGIVGSTDNAIPAAPTRDGYTFLGWTLNNADVFTNGETTFTMPVDTDVVYLAKWNENVIINFADTGTPAVASREVPGGSEWTDKPDVSNNKEGYKFLYWEGEGVVNGQLPDNYPVATAGNTEFTYTAVWAKLVEISFDDDGGTFDPAVQNPYKGDDIYAGNTWSSAVPTFDVQNYANEKITKTGYALMGWQVNGGEIITNFPDKYPAENTVYKAVWRPVNVQVIYVVDPDAASADEVDVTTADQVQSVYVPYDSTYSVITYSDENGEVTSWTDENGNAYVPGTDTVTVASPLVTFTNGTPDIVYLIGIMNPDSHFAEFDPDGGTWNDDTTENKKFTVNVGDAITAPADPARSGYTFDGWSPAPGVMGNEDVTFTAMWTPVDYTVKYMRHYTDDDTEIVDTISFGGDQGIEYPQDPEREGYDFIGWFTDKAGTTEFTTLPADETTFEVYAKWEIQKYTVTYDVDGGSAVTPGSVDVVFDADIPDEPDTAKEGYTLDGWVYTDENDVAYTGEKMPAYDLTATAQWTANTYKINYIKNGGNWVLSDTQDFDLYTYGTDTPEVRDADDIRKTGSEFKNVTLDSEGNTVFTGDWAQILANAAQISGGQDNEYELTVYVQWDLNKYNLTVELDGGEFGEGVTSPAREYYYGDTLPAMPAATKTGYSPATPAWVYTNTETGDTITPDPETMPDCNVTVTAQWTVNTYTITYDVAGGDAIDPASYTFEYDKVITSDPTTQKKGYTFGGWEFIDENDDVFAVTPGTTKMPASDLTATAQWTANTYTLTIVPMGGTWTDDSSTLNKTVSKVYNEAFTAVTAADIQKTGHTFDGVTLDEAGNEAFDYSYDTILEKATLLSGTEYGLTVYVKWKVNQYTIKFETNGGSEIADYTRDYGAPVENINQTKVPTKENFVFDKWYADQALTTEFEVPSTMPVYDTNGEPYTTVYAKYTDADATYTVEVYLQNVDGTYPTDPALVSDTLHGVAGNIVSRETLAGTVYPDGLPEGFKISENSASTFEVPGESDTDKVYELYLDRQSYVVTYNYVDTNGDPIHAPRTENVIFGADVPAYPVVDDNYNLSEEPPVITPALTDGKMPAEPVSVTYTYIPKAAPTYTITYYDFDKSTVVDEIAMPAGTQITATTKDLSDPGEGWTSVGTWTYYVASDNSVYTDNVYPSEDLYAFPDKASKTVKVEYFSDEGIVGSYNIRYWASEGVKTEYAVAEKNGITKWRLNDEATGTIMTAGDPYEFTATDIENGVKFYAVVTYEITFDAAGGHFGDDPAETTKTVTAAAGETPTCEEPVWDKHTFNGWTPDVGAANGDKTYYATWEEAKYKITWWKNSGGDVHDETELAEDDVIDDNTPTDPSAETGYHFTEWKYFKDVDGNKGDPYTGTAMPAYDLIAEPVFEKNTNALVYLDENGNQIGDAQNVKYGDPIPEPTGQEPEKPGHTLEWQTDDGKTPADFPDGMPDEPLTFKPVFTPKTYTVTFNPGEGAFPGNDTEPKTVEATFGQAIAAPKDTDNNPIEPELEGNTFKEWKAGDKTLDDYNNDNGMPDDDNLVFTAVFTPNQYPIVFIDDGNTVVNEEGTYGQTFSNLAPTYEPTKTGHSFDGWFTADDVKYDETLTVPVDGYTFTARYTPKQYDVIFQDIDGNQIGDVQKVTYGNNLDGVTVPDAPVIPGKEFTVWLETTSDETFDDVTSMPARNLIFKATYEDLVYTVIFIANGTTLSTVTPLAYNADMPAAPADSDAVANAPANKEFTGKWNTAEDGSGTEYSASAKVTENFTFYAVYAQATSNIIYNDADGNPVYTFTDVEAGKPFPKPEDATPPIEAPAVPGKTFEGWFTDDGKTPDEFSTVTGDVTFTAKYRSLIKLVAVDGKDTVVERDGKVEMNTPASMTSIPKGVTSVLETDRETYNYDNSGDFSKWYITGIPQGVKIADLGNYIEVTDSTNGYFEVDAATIPINGRAGTGVVVKVYDKMDTPDDKTDDKFIEQFTIVIYGDVDGNGWVENSDYILMKKGLTDYMSVYGDKAYLEKAADVTENGHVEDPDALEIKMYLKGKRTVDQMLGKTEVI